MSKEVAEALRWALFETAMGDKLVSAFEKLTGLGLVDLSQVEADEVAATEAEPYGHEAYAGLAREVGSDA